MWVHSGEVDEPGACYIEWSKSERESQIWIYMCTYICINIWYLIYIWDIHTYISSVQSLSHVQLFATQGLQHISFPCPSPTPRANSNACPSCQWCHPTISSSVIPFSSCLQSFPASGSFQMGQFFSSGGQSIGVSASASVLPMNTQDWTPLGWTGWISLQSKGLSRVFSNTTHTYIYGIYKNDIDGV